MPEAGQHVAGFRLISELGRGTFGRVFLAEQTALAGRFVALKISSDISSEAHALAQLQHANIVPVYSIHEIGTWNAVCMPYLGATTLQSLMQTVQSAKKLPTSAAELVENWRKAPSTRARAEDSTTPRSAPAHEWERPSSAPANHPRPSRTPSNLETLEEKSYIDGVVWMVAALADGLAHAHSRGILHRDLKPANIIITDDWRPMLVDFNLSQDVKCIQDAALLVGGTLPYMSPEQIVEYQRRGAGASAVDERSDVYSLGIVLFEMLTARHPFKPARCEDSNWVLEDRTGEPPSARAINNGVSPRIDAVVRHCLQSNPEARYPNARALHQDLQCCLDRRPLSEAPDPSWKERSRRALQRNRFLVYSAAVASAIIATVLCVAEASVWNAKLEAAGLWQSTNRQAAPIWLRFETQVTDRGGFLQTKADCEKLLAGYRVAEDPKWFSQPRVRYLHPGKQEELRRRATALLVVLAEAAKVEAAGVEDPGLRKARLEEAEMWNARAASCWDAERLPRGLIHQSAQLKRLTGQKDEAAKLAAAADAAPLRDIEDATLYCSILAADRDLKCALAAASAALRFDPTDGTALFLKGLCHRELGENKEAARCWSACAPKWESGYLHRLLASIENASDDEEHRFAAIEHLALAVRLEPAAEAFIERAIAHNRRRLHDAALHDLDEAAKLGASPFKVAQRRSLVLKEAGRPAAAKAAEEAVRSMQPHEAEDWISHARAREISDRDGAAADFEKALLRQPWSYAALMARSTLPSTEGRLNSSTLPLLNRLVALFPDRVNSRRIRACTLAAVGQREEALADMEELRRRDPHNPSHVFTLAGIFAQTSRFEPADAKTSLAALKSLASDQRFRKKILSDPTLEPVRRLPEFAAVLDAIKSADEQAQRQ